MEMDQGPGRGQGEKAKGWIRQNHQPILPQGRPKFTMGEMGHGPGQAAEQASRTAPGLDSQAREVRPSRHLIPIPGHRDKQGGPGQGPENQRQPGQNRPDVAPSGGPLAFCTAVHVAAR